MNLPHDFGIAHLGMPIREMKVHKETYTQMLTASVFIVLNLESHMSINLMTRLTKCGTANSGILFRNKGNGLLIPATTWMTLKNIMQSERKQLQKTTYFMIPFT